MANFKVEQWRKPISFNQRTGNKTGGNILAKLFVPIVHFDKCPSTLTLNVDGENVELNKVDREYQGKDDSVLYSEIVNNNVEHQVALDLTI